MKKITAVVRDLESVDLSELIAIADWVQVEQVNEQPAQRVRRRPEKRRRKRNLRGCA